MINRYLLSTIRYKFIQKAAILLFTSCLLAVGQNTRAEDQDEEGKQPIIINADRIEFATNKKEVTATGNVQVDYKGTKLTCQKLTVNNLTKEGVAEGNARMDQKEGIIEGQKIFYNFETKVGVIADAKFRANPYFGKARKIDKVSEREFIAKYGYMTTCGYDKPHYRIKSKKMNIFPDDKVQTEKDIFLIRDVPLLYMPRYSHSLKEPIMHIQMMPGKSKDWGPYLLTATRYQLADNVIGRIYLDGRTTKGVAEGIGVNYTSEEVGKGNFKYYYTQERDHDLLKTDRQNRKFERYFIRWRHKWDIAKTTNLTAEYYKIKDSKMSTMGSQYNILKDYFFREYEKDSQPPSYVLLHHAFRYSTMDFEMQKRTNRWYDPGYIEKLPELRYTMASNQIGSTPFYFEDGTSIGNYNKKNTSTSTPATNDTTPDAHVNRLDTTNKFSLPMKVAFIRFTPFVSDRTTIYDKDVNGNSIAPRTIFSSGADMSTKFYRLFNIKSNVLGMDINGLRHIITPTVGYNYSHSPTTSPAHLRQIDGVDSINSSNNAASLELSNKLQTKRKGMSVDVVDFLVKSSYVFKPKTGDKHGSNLSDILFDLKLLPYSWLRIEADATYKHSGNRSDTGYGTFTNVNYDVDFSFGEDRSFGIGQRYQRKGGNEITFTLIWRLNPKWKFSLYQRRNRGHDPALRRGLREQEYSITRNFHCWDVDLTYNLKRNHGETLWLVFRLKAFPELEFEMNQSYHQPKSGSQSNP